MPIDELQDYSFYVWGGHDYLSEELTVVVKVYAFFVPEDDPTREPIVQILTYETMLNAPDPTSSFYYVAYHDNLDIDYTVLPGAVGAQTKWSQVAYWSKRNNGNSISDLLMPIVNTITIDDNLRQRGGYTNAGGPAIFDPLFAPNPSGSGVIFYESGSIYAGDVNIVTDIILQPGVEITIYGNNINVSPEVNLPQGVRLVATGRNTEANQASRSVIDAMCNSETYIANRDFGRYAAPDSTTTEQEEVLVDVEARLLPNPAKGSTVLRYNLIEKAKVRISVIDVLGQENILLNSSQAAGTQELTINLSDYPAGLYYCRLMVNGEQRSLPLRVQR